MRLKRQRCPVLLGEAAGNIDVGRGVTLIDAVLWLFVEWVIWRFY